MMIFYTNTLSFHLEIINFNNNFNSSKCMNLFQPVLKVRYRDLIKITSNTINLRGIYMDNTYNTINYIFHTQSLIFTYIAPKISK